MSNKKNREKQVIKILQEFNSGSSDITMFEKYGMSSADIFDLRQKHKKLEKGILKEFVDLHEENCKLKTMYADLRIQYRQLKELMSEEF